MHHEHHAVMPHVNFMTKHAVVDPSMMAQKEELLMYVENRQEEERLKEFERQTKLRAKVARIKMEQEKLAKELAEKEKMDVFNRRYQYQKIKKEVPKVKREKVVVLGGYNELQKETPIEIEQGEGVSSSGMQTQQKLFNQMRMTNSEPIRVQEQPANTNIVGKEDMGNGYEIVFMDNRSVNHAENRYQNIRSRMKR